MYTPGQVPISPGALPDFLNAELRSIARAMQDSVPFIQLAMLHAVPDKPRDGMVVRADGTSWNPGSGAGVYVYRGAAWHLLG